MTKDTVQYICIHTPIAGQVYTNDYNGHAFSYHDLTEGSEMLKRQQTSILCAPANSDYSTISLS